MVALRLVTFNWQGGAGGGGGQSRLYFAPSKSTLQMQSAIEDFFAAWGAIAAAPYTGNWDGTWRVVESTTGQVTGSGSTGGRSGAGLVADQEMANQTQWVASLRTGQFVNGRELRGRIFIPGPPITASENGQPTPATLTSIQGAVNILRQVGDLSVFSPTHLVTGVATGVEPFTEWGVLRSRRN